MKIIETELPGVYVIEPRLFEDSRGHFLETYQDLRYREHGIEERFVQDNLSWSSHGVLRGLHYQLGRPQAKLVTVVRGTIFDVAVDIRRGSPTFGRWIGVELDGESHRQIFVPKGFAHGFCVLSETAAVTYKCSDYYAPADERGLRWDDPGVAVAWPVQEPLLSEKDQNYPILDEIAEEDLPVYEELP